MNTMKPGWFALSIVMILIGAVWLLQGVGLLGGSFMTGQTRWAVIGCVTAGAGLVLLAVSRRSRVG